LLSPTKEKIEREVVSEIEHVRRDADGEQTEREVVADKEHVERVADADKVKTEREASPAAG